MLFQGRSHRVKFGREKLCRTCTDSCSVCMCWLSYNSLYVHVTLKINYSKAKYQVSSWFLNTINFQNLAMSILTRFQYDFITFPLYKIQWAKPDFQQFIITQRYFSKQNHLCILAIVICKHPTVTLVSVNQSVTCKPMHTFSSFIVKWKSFATCVCVCVHVNLTKP